MWVSRCLQGVSLLVHLLVCLGNTSLFSEEDFPLSCQAFTKVLIDPILGFLYLQGLWIPGPLGHLQRGLVETTHAGLHVVQGDFDTCWCLFSPLSVRFKLVA